LVHSATRFGTAALQFARTLDQDDSVVGRRDLGQERVDQRGLAGRVPLATSTFFRSWAARRSSSAWPADMMAAST
jgi:hypothetical protein